MCLKKLGRNAELVDSHRSGAEHGDQHDQFKLGYLYHKGIGVEQDFEKAAKWYRLAADQGNAVAWENLGQLYGDGKGVPLDYDQEISCYKKALSLDPDHAHVMNTYAWMLATCEDESFRNYPEAVKMAERSVELDEQFHSLDTLAVACDHNGQYAKAVEAQKRLIAFRQKKDPRKEVPKGMANRLKKYEKKLAEQNQ